MWATVDSIHAAILNNWVLIRDVQDVVLKIHILEEELWRIVRTISVFALTFFAYFDKPLSGIYLDASMKSNEATIRVGK